MSQNDWECGAMSCGLPAIKCYLIKPTGRLVTSEFPEKGLSETAKTTHSGRESGGDELVTVNFIKVMKFYEFITRAVSWNRQKPEMTAVCLRSRSASNWFLFKLQSVLAVPR